MEHQQQQGRGGGAQQQAQRQLAQRQAGLALGALQADQRRHRGHRQRGVQCARKGGHGRMQRQGQQQQRAGRLPARAHACQPQHGKWQGQRQVAVERRAARMHGGKRRRDAVVAGHVEDARKHRPFPQRAAGHQSQARQHARQRMAPQAVQLRAGVAQQQRQQQHGPAPGFAQAHAVPGAEVIVPGVQRIWRQRQQAAQQGDQRRQAGQHQQQRRAGRQAGPPGARLPAPVAAGHHQQQQQVDFLEKKPARPWRQVQHGQQRRQAEQP